MKRNNSTDEYNIGKFIKITLAVIIFFGLIYFLTTGVVEKRKKELQSTPNETTFNEIIVSKLLEQSDEDYYVLLYTQDDNYYSSYSQIQTTYNNAEKDVKLYYIDLSNTMNRKFLAETSNQNATSIDDFAFKSGTLINVSKNKITKYLEGYLDIAEALK